MSIRMMNQKYIKDHDLVTVHRVQEEKRSRYDSYFLKRMFWLSMFATLSLISSLQATFFAPKTEDEFYNILDKHELAIVHFNPHDQVESDNNVADEDLAGADNKKVAIDPELEEKVERLKDSFVSVGNKDRYVKARVAFIGVNTNKLPYLAQDFGVSPDEIATFILFKGGRVYKKQGKHIKRVGYLNKSELKDFVERYFGPFIDDILRKQKQQQQARATTRYVYTQPNSYYVDDAYDYYPSYYDYGYSPYYWGPGFGLGFGLGGFGFGIGGGW